MKSSGLLRQHARHVGLGVCLALFLQAPLVAADPSTEIRVITGVVSSNAGGNTALIGDGQPSNGGIIGPNGQLIRFSHDPSQTLSQFAQMFAETFGTDTQNQGGPVSAPGNRNSLGGVATGGGGGGSGTSN